MGVERLRRLETDMLAVDSGGVKSSWGFLSSLGGLGG